MAAAISACESVQCRSFGGECDQLQLYEILLADVRRTWLEPCVQLQCGGPRLPAYRSAIQRLSAYRSAIQGLPASRAAIRSVIQGVPAWGLPAYRSAIRGLPAYLAAIRSAIQGLPARGLPAYRSAIPGLVSQRCHHQRGREAQAVAALAWAPVSKTSDASTPASVSTTGDQRMREGLSN